MKNLKKIMAVLIAAVMVFAMGITVFAAPTTPTETSGMTLTINDTRTNRQFEAYQIITGDLSGTETEGYVLSNMKWGSGVTKTGALSSTEIDALPGKNASHDEIDAYIRNNFTLTNVKFNSRAKTGEGATGYEFINLPAGWYLIKEVTETEGKDDFTSAFMMEVVGDASANIKGSKTTVEKKVDDINDSTANAESLQDSADYDIGDAVPFTLTATLGNDLIDYDTYKLIFHDTMSTGLNYNQITSVTIDGTPISNGYTAVTNAAYDSATNGYTALSGTVLTVTFNDVLALGAQAGSKVEVKYTAILTESAVIGAAGNPNKVYLEYSNNPSNNGLGKTSEDTNIVFTYKTVVDKIDKDGNALNGAGFTLYKVPSTFTLPTGSDYEAMNTTVANANISGFTSKTIAAANDKNQFEFRGLDDGTYVLCETTTPQGYNTMQPLVFTVTATHSPESATPELLTLNVSDPLNALHASTTDGTIDKKAGTPHSIVSGEVYGEIVNNKGTQLPSTGGIGTTIFYIIGGVIVLAAVIILVVRSKKSSAK